MGDLISVVIPAYNSAQYIGGCIDSVLVQSYTYLEILLIDDGSSDGTKAFCEKKCQEDTRVRLLCQQHKGVSAARNRGIREAKGKYLFFLDSDDVIHPELLGTLYLLLEKYRAAVGTESRYDASEGAFQKPAGWKLPKEKEYKSIYLESAEAVRNLLGGNTEAALYGIGGKMIRRDVLDDVRFHEILSHGEDTKFLYQLLARGADVVVFPHSWYYYRRHAGGASRIFSIRAIQSRYKAEVYVRNSEMEHNRMAHAVHWEERIVDLLIKWHMESHNNPDERVNKFVRGLADSESRLRIFSQISRRCKLRFYLAFYCYPLYRIVRVLGLSLIRLRDGAARYLGIHR